MRVIAGTLGGRTLRTVKDLSIRPATDRARQVIFDVLATRLDLDGASVLDLFAGSGSLGIEALSRGAGRVTFVEQAVPSIDVLYQNLRTLDLMDRSEVVRADVFRYLKQNPRRFDLVFVDPPYKLPTITGIPDVIAQSEVITPGGWMVMEHSQFTPIEPDPSVFDIIRKELGQTIVLILQRRSSTTEPSSS